VVVEREAGRGWRWTGSAARAQATAGQTVGRWAVWSVAIKVCAGITLISLTEFRLLLPSDGRLAGMYTSMNAPPLPTSLPALGLDDVPLHRAGGAPGPLAGPPAILPEPLASLPLRLGSRLARLGADPAWRRSALDLGPRGRPGTGGGGDGPHRVAPDEHASARAGSDFLGFLSAILGLSGETLVRNAVGSSPAREELDATGMDGTGGSASGSGLSLGEGLGNEANEVSGRVGVVWEEKRLGWVEGG